MASERDGEFEQELRRALKSAPWMGISALVHGIVLLVAMQFEYGPASEAAEVGLTVAMVPPDVAVLEAPPVVEPETPQVVEPREDVLEEPAVPDESVETTGEEEFHALAPAAFDSRFRNDVIGVGDGAGGPSGSKGGRLHGPASRSSTASQRAVERGLVWLRKHQDERGFWDCDGFTTRCTQNLCDGKGGALHDVGVTGLATLAFLGAGHTPRNGQHRETVRSALRWLESAQDPDDGCFGTKSGQHFLYGHALAALAMVEAYALSNEPQLKRLAQRGLDFISRSRNPYAAWRYAYPPDGDNDVSVSGWMLFALFAGRDAGLQVDDGAIEQGLAWVRSMADPASGRTGYHERGSLPAREPGASDRWPAERSESMTACAMLLEIFAGATSSTDSLARPTSLLLAKLPRWDEEAGSIDYYYWYYGTYTMWQLGGRAWDVWQRALLDTIVTHQHTTGDETGSWDPQVDPWGREGGRVYSTALNTLSLEVYYRYDRLFGAR